MTSLFCCQMEGWLKVKNSSQQLTTSPTMNCHRKVNGRLLIIQLNHSQKRKQHSGLFQALKIHYCSTTMAIKSAFFIQEKKIPA